MSEPTAGNPFLRAWRWWFAIPISIRCAIGFWITLLLGVFIRVTIQPIDAQSVVPIYLAAGERWVHSELLYPAVTGHDLYRNPPGVAALFAPLAFLNPKVAAILWRLACVIAYLFGVRGLIHDVLPPLSAWRRAVIWTFAAVLVLPSFNNGQINLMIVAAAVCGTVACARQNWWTAAAWLAFAGWLKVYPLAVGLLCVLVALRQLSWRLAVMLALLFGLPFLLQNPTYVWDRHHEFVDEMKRDDRTASYSLTRAPRDWTIIPRLWGDVVVSRTVSQGVGLIAAVGMAAAVCWANRKASLGTATPERTAFLPPLLLGLIWTTLFGPSTEMNTYSMLAPAAGVVAVGSHRKWISVCGWIGTGLLTSAVVRGSFPSDGPYKMMEVQAIATIVLLIGTVGWTLTQSPRTPVGSNTH